MALPHRSVQLRQERLLGIDRRVLQPFRGLRGLPITKYVTLRQMGFGTDQLRIAVVKDLSRDLAHAVLAVYVDGDVFILDNANGKVRPQAEVNEYAPYYSVNEQARWAHAAAPARVASAASLFTKF